VPELTPLPQSFVVRRWVDPVVERAGFPVSSLYTETVLLPVLGPSTTLCLRRLGGWATAFRDRGRHRPVGPGSRAQ
jgi:hypothetical protein